MENIMENYIKIRFLNIRENFYHDTGNTLYSFVELLKIPALYVSKSQFVSCNKKNCRCEKLSQMLSDYICRHLGYKVPIFCISFEIPYVYVNHVKHEQNSHFDFTPDNNVWNVILVNNPFGIIVLKNKKSQTAKIAIYNYRNYTKTKNTNFKNLIDYVLDQYHVSDPENYTWTSYHVMDKTNDVTTKKHNLMDYLIPGISAIATVMFILVLMRRRK